MARGLDIQKLSSLTEEMCKARVERHVTLTSLSVMRLVTLISALTIGPKDV